MMTPGSSMTMLLTSIVAPAPGGSHPFALSTAAVITLCLAVVTGVLVPVLLFRMGKADRRADAREAAARKAAEARENDAREFRKDMLERLSKQDIALSEVTRALAVVVQRADDSFVTLGRVPQLGEDVKVLKSRMDQHDKWAKISRDELLANDRELGRTRGSS